MPICCVLQRKEPRQDVRREIQSREISGISMLGQLSLVAMNCCNLHRTDALRNTTEAENNDPNQNF